jgi:hypothetical protein
MTSWCRPKDAETTVVVTQLLPMERRPEKEEARPLVADDPTLQRDPPIHHRSQRRHGMSLHCGIQPGFRGWQPPETLAATARSLPPEGTKVPRPAKACRRSGRPRHAISRERRTLCWRNGDSSDAPGRLSSPTREWAAGHPAARLSVRPADQGYLLAARNWPGVIPVSRRKTEVRCPGAPAV